MNRLCVVFTGPQQVSVVEESLPDPAPDQALVQTLFSAISPGTEMLIYRGQFPDDLNVDETIPALSGRFGYPLRYGYSAVGRVIGMGREVDREWEGRLVFSFQPHASHFLARPEELDRKSTRLNSSHLA